MHAVNLRNMLGASCRTQREEQGDESDEFLTLFNHRLNLIDGARTETGFWVVRDVVSRRRKKKSFPMKIDLIFRSSRNIQFDFIAPVEHKNYIWNWFQRIYHR